MSFCSACGATLTGSDAFCSSCGKQVVQPSASQSTFSNIPSREQDLQPIENHLTKAILVTVFCCLPFGIVSIINAASVSDKQRAGDVAGAMNAAKKADDWANYGLIAGCVVFGLYFIIGVFAAF